MSKKNQQGIKISGTHNGRTFSQGVVRGDVWTRKFTGILYKPEPSFSWDKQSVLQARRVGAKKFLGKYMRKNYRVGIDELIEHGIPISFGNGEQLRYPLSKMETDADTATTQPKTDTRNPATIAPAYQSEIGERQLTLFAG